MTSELITWPLRASLGASRIALRGTVEATRLAIELAGDAVRLMRPPSEATKRDRDAATQPATPPPAQGESPGLTPAPGPPARASSPAGPAESSAGATELPADVVELRVRAGDPSADAEAELVAEFAEPGAEEGAGPELSVREPWEGYAQLDADAVIDRIALASGAELAVVELYEQAHKQRQTVLEAVERRLKTV
jgi:hypothetical protein